MHSHFTAVFDACVLYPATLRNLLIQLATTTLFRARWTDEIHEEWIRTLLTNRPDIPRERLDALRTCIDRAVPDGLVTGYESLVEGLTLPDANDRHVLAAAIRCHAGVIVTVNLKDFPADALRDVGVEAQHPDEFILHLIDLDPGVVHQALRDVRKRLTRPAYDVEAFLAMLHRQGLPKSVSRLRGGDIRL